MTQGFRGNFDQSDKPFGVLDHLLPDPLPADPTPIFRAWYDKAHAQNVQPNPNAFTLATIDPDGTPSARIVLCKILREGDGYLSFFTNYTGRKGRALAANPRAAAVFHWDDLDKQVRIEGPVLRSPEAESDAYFKSRPWISRIGAWTSDQTEPIDSRARMQEKLDATYRRFGLDPDRLPDRDAHVEIPRPPHWGGFRIYFERLELWCAGVGRLHDRARWTRTLRRTTVGGDDVFEPASAWTCTRLQP